MLFKVIGRITDKRSNVGYILKDTEGKTWNLSKEAAGKLAVNILIINAIYNSKSMSLSGKEVKLSELPGTPISSIEKFDDTDLPDLTPKLSYHDACERYMLKAKLANVDDFYLSCERNDRVRLNYVKREFSRKRVVVPPFITDFGNPNFYGYDGPMQGCDIEDIIIDNSTERGIRCYKMLDGLRSKRIRVTFKHPEMVIDLSYMFSRCKLLESVELVNLKDANNVISMAGMFSGCENLRYFDFGDLNTENVVNTKQMFNECYKLKEVNFRDSKFRSVTNMSEMFARCKSLEAINLSNMSASNVTDIHGIFRGCAELSRANISGISHKAIRDASDAFKSCKKLMDVELGDFALDSSANSMCMFYECESLEGLDLSKFNLTENEFKSLLIGCDYKKVQFPDGVVLS